MSLDDVRQYEAQMQSKTNSLLAATKIQEDISNTPESPKSPKKGYFSWF